MKQYKNLKLSLNKKKPLTVAKPVRKNLTGREKNKDIKIETKMNSQEEENEISLQNFSKTPFPLRVIDNINFTKNEEEIKFDDSKSQSVSVIEKKICDKSTHSNDKTGNTGTNYSRNKIRQPNFNLKRESDKASNYLNYNLGDTKNLTLALEGDSSTSKNNTIITNNKNYIPQIEFDADSLQSESNSISE